MNKYIFDLYLMPWKFVYDNFIKSKAADKLPWH